MKSLGKIVLFVTVTFLVWSLWAPEVYAAGISRGARSSAPMFTGNMALGIGFSTVSASQDDLNSAIDAAHSADSSVSTKSLGSAYEFFVNWIYHLDNSTYAFVFRPSYFMQSATGSGNAGSYDYKLTGYTVFPMMRIYPLENNFIHFFMQGGLGYGSLGGDIQAGASSLTFSGSAFGAIGGIGVDFCFTEVHCLTIEGNMRYLPIARNLSTGGTCTSIPGISQCGNSSEVEHNSSDLSTTMSGIQGVVAYTMNF